MATSNEILELRGLVQEANNAAPWTDEFLGGLIDRYGIKASARSIWIQKAGERVDLVTISEGGSTRSASDAHKHALEMVDVFGEDPSAAPAVRTHSRRAVRG